MASILTGTTGVGHKQIVRQLFRKIDNNLLDGWIKGEDLEKYDSEEGILNISKAQWDAIWERLDLNKDNKVDYSEFRIAVSDYDELFTDNSINYLFALIDKDGDGFLTI